MAELTRDKKESKTRAFWVALLILLALCEAVARIVYPSVLGKGTEGYLSSAAYVQDILSAARDSHSVVMMGDSILGPSALREHHVENPQRNQLSAILRTMLKSSNVPVVTVSADGMLPADMAAALMLPSPRLTNHLIVVLNVRMFSPDFQVAGRDFFFSFLKKESPYSGDPLFRISDEALGSRLFNAATQSSTLFRLLYQMRGLWFTPNPQAAFQVLFERAFGEATDGDLKEAILRSRVQSFYAPRLWMESDVQISKLLELARSAISQGGRILVVMAPQNPQFLPTPEAALQLRRNVARLEVLLKEIDGVRFHSFVDAYPTEYFLDHCHLSPQGNETFARAIIEQMEEQP